MTTAARPLVNADELRTLLATPEVKVVVLDVRFVPDGSDGRAAYDAGHIPGAQFVDLPRDLAGPPQPELGRRPLPSSEQLQASLRRWGVDHDSTVVLYDDRRNLSAARGWWLLRWAGLKDVRVLDGALDAWRAIGGELVTEIPGSTPGTVHVTIGSLPTVTIDEVVAQVGGDSDEHTLVDARGAAEYRGEHGGLGGEPGGHIPGALSLPSTDLLDQQGSFLPPEDILDRVAALGLAPDDAVVAYCGGGVVAAHLLLGLASAGVEGTLFPGSWSQWALDPSRPVASGADPS